MDSKSFDVSVKAAGPDDGLKEGQFTGYASVFGNRDSTGDVVVKGAFAETLAEWDAKGDVIPLLWGHDSNDPFSNIGSVDAKEDAHGLLVTGTLDLDNPKAKQVYKLIKGRRVNQMSFMYEILDSSYAELDGDTVQELKRLKLYEASIVFIGANQATEILAVKAVADGLTVDLKAGRAISAKNETELRKAYEAIGAVLAALGDSEDPEKANGEEPAVKDNEPAQTIVSVQSEQPTPAPSADVWSATLTLIELEGITL